MPEKLRRIVIFASLMIVAVFYSTEGLTAAPKQKPKADTKQPIHIVSDRMDAYNEERVVVFYGNAVATQGARTIRADRLTLYYKQDTNTAGGSTAGIESTGNLEKVVATGKVSITEGDRTATGEEAVFLQDTQKITVTGNAVLREGTNVVRGDRVVVFLDENRGVVESLENRRVTATIYPKEDERKKK